MRSRLDRRNYNYNPAAHRALVTVEYAGELCLAQCLWLPEHERKEHGTYGQITIDTANHFLQTQLNAPDIRISGPDGETSTHHKIGKEAPATAYHTYDWRVGGDMLRYKHSGFADHDHLRWTIRPENEDVPHDYDPDSYPVLSEADQQELIQTLSTATPFEGPVNEGEFPPMTL